METGAHQPYYFYPTYIGIGSSSKYYIVTGIIRNHNVFFLKDSINDTSDKKITNTYNPPRTLC